MADTSTHLDLPYLAPAQAQKHVTHNEALQILDAVVQLAIVDRTLGVPPTSIVTGARYIVAPTGASGVWNGHENEVAVWTGVGWVFLSAQIGWRAWVEAENAEVVWHSDAWQLMPASVGSLDNVAGVGINAAADAVNRLAVSSPSTLLNHEGAGHQLKINKATVTDTSSLLFQNGFSGRAEMGLAGSDAFSIKVSGDGSNWTDALAFDPLSGQASGAAVQLDMSDDTAGRLMRTGAFGLGRTDMSAPVSNDLDNALVTGWYDIDSATLNTPLGGDVGMCLSQSRSAQRTVQIVFRTGGGAEPEMYIRQTYGATTWGAWRPLTPEYGSNANGNYVRFADGTQICWAVKSSTDVLSGSSGGLYWDQETVVFPAAFTTGPHVSPNALDVSSGLYWGTVSGVPSTTGFVFQAVGNTSGGTFRITYMAVGRWI